MNNDFSASNVITAERRQSFRPSMKTGPRGSGSNINHVVAQPAFQYCQKKQRKVAKEVCLNLCQQGLGGYKQTWWHKCQKQQGVKQMTTQKEKMITKEHGYHRIGKFDVSVKKMLTGDEKIELGKKHCELLFEIEDLLTKKKRFDDSVKGEIAVKTQESREAARMIYDGYKFETLNLPCFLDTEQQERVYIDTATGEEVAREPMREEDRQLNLEN